MSEEIRLTKSNHHDLAPTERQQILRKLKRSPALDRGALATHAEKIRKEVVAERKVQK